MIPAKNVLRGQSPMELLKPRELNQKTELRRPATTWRVTIPDQSDTLGEADRAEIDRNRWTIGR